MPLSGQVAIITGCGGGIGRGIAARLASLGANIVVNDVVEDAAKAVVAEVEALGREAIVSTASVTESDAVAGMVDAAVEKWGRLDILINNAGITRDALMLRMKDEQWDAVLDINLKGAFLCTRAAVRPMMKARYGRIVNIASIVGATGNAGQANYSASKGGLIALTKTTALEFASRNVTCNAVAPGVVDTAMFRALSEEVQKEWMERVPLSRPGTPEDVADAVSFFCLPMSSYVTGQVLHVNGGLYM